MVGNTPEPLQTNSRSMMDATPSQKYNQLLNDISLVQNSSEIIEDATQLFEGDDADSDHQESQEVQMLMDNMKQTDS